MVDSGWLSYKYQKDEIEYRVGFGCFLTILCMITLQLQSYCFVNSHCYKFVAYEIKQKGNKYFLVIAVLTVAWNFFMVAAYNMFLIYI
jgi:hypothetical protein